MTRANHATTTSSRDVSRLFDEFHPSSWDQHNWHPHVDIKDEDTQYLIIADLPGVAPENVEVTLDGQLLTIQGHRSTELDAHEEGFTRRERFSGSFMRQFTLPGNADATHISASADKGVLSVIIPKSAKNRPRSIEVDG